MRPISHGTEAAAPAPLAAAHIHQPPGTPLQRHSAWRFPVPYLFGGLAAILGLTFLALLVLACTRRKLPRFMGRASIAADVGGGGTEAGEGKDDDDAWRCPLGPSVLVIMAGDEKPTFLATPASSPCSSDDCTTRVKGGEESDAGEEMSTAPGTEPAQEGRRGHQQHNRLHVQ